MNVNTYSISKDGNKKITKNIQVRELRCKDGITDTIKEDWVVVCIAQYVRDVFNKPININSAYRTKEYNARPDVGGSSGSKHLISCALDVWISSVAPQLIANLVYSIGLVRVGVYSNFIHMDTDRSPVWLSQGNFTKVNVPYMNKVISSTKNNKDYLVAIIQYKLNIMGYNCGAEDGIAGKLFESAVKKFQKNKNMATPNTHKPINIT